MESVKKSKKELMYERIEKHGENLNRIFNTGIDNIELCKKLHSLEVKANAIMCHRCNGELYEGNLADLETEAEKILGYRYSELVHLNQDPRGYTFKIDDELVREKDLVIYRDLGGYGIIAPDLTNE